MVRCWTLAILIGALEGDEQTFSVGGRLAGAQRSLQDPCVTWSLFQAAVEECKRHAKEILNSRAFGQDCVDTPRP